MISAWFFVVETLVMHAWAMGRGDLLEAVFWLAGAVFFVVCALEEERRRQAIANRASARITALQAMSRDHDRRRRLAATLIRIGDHDGLAALVRGAWQLDDLARERRPTKPERRA